MGQYGADLGNKNVTDPNQAKWGELDPNEKAARLTAGVTHGFGQGLQNYSQQGQMQRPGGNQMNPMQFAPQTQQPDYLSKLLTGNNLNFYGGGQ